MLTDLRKPAKAQMLIRAIAVSQQIHPAA